MSHRPVAALLAVILASGAAPSLSAQAVAKVTAATPAGCTKAINDWRVAQTAPARDAYAKATPETKADLTAKYQAALNAAASGVERVAGECSSGFNLASIPAAQLPELIALYSTARDTANARRATERLLTATDLPPRTHGQALIIAMNQEVAKASTYFGIIDGAERYIAQIDQLPDSLNDLKLSAHRSMLGRYEYLDVADGLQQHATAVITLARGLNKPTDMISGMSSLARSFADRLQPDSALRILDNAEKELGAPATAAFKDFRNRYALIGTRASAIPAEWWINTDKGSVVTPAPGKVTLIEFTAHWCGPCKNSYPGLISVADRFRGKGFEGVMVTSLYGYLGTQKDLTPAQEVAADREYFGKEHALPFPVAINTTPKVPAEGASYAQPKPDMDYRVGGIPQIIIVDKRGVIRQIVTGWDRGNTERFSKLIEQLLAEPIQ